MYQTCKVHAPIPCKVWDKEGLPHDRDYEELDQSATDPDQEADHPQAHG